MDYNWTTVKTRVLFVCIHNSARSYRSNPITDSRVSINFWLFSNALLRLLRFGAWLSSMTIKNYQQRGDADEAP